MKLQTPRVVENRLSFLPIRTQSRYNRSNLYHCSIIGLIMPHNALAVRYPSELSYSVSQGRFDRYTLTHTPNIDPTFSMMLFILYKVKMQKWVVKSLITYFPVLLKNRKGDSGKIPLGWGMRVIFYQEYKTTFLGPKFVRLVFFIIFEISKTRS